MITEADSLSCRVFFPSNFAISGYFFFSYLSNFILCRLFLLYWELLPCRVWQERMEAPQRSWENVLQSEQLRMKLEHKLRNLNTMKPKPVMNPNTDCILQQGSWHMWVDNSNTQTCVCVDENNEIVCTTIPLFLEFIMGTWPLKESRTAQFKAFCPDYIGQTSINRHKSHYSTQQKNLLMSAYQNILKTHY